MLDDGHAFIKGNFLTLIFGLVVVDASLELHTKLVLDSFRKYVLHRAVDKPVS